MTAEARAEIMHLPVEEPKRKPKNARQHIDDLDIAPEAMLRGRISLAEAYPDIAKQWHPTKNGKVAAHHIPKSSRLIVWWQCEYGHEWKAPVDGRTQKHNSACPVCLNRQVLVGVNDLTTTHPEIAQQWHPTKNLPLKPEDVVAGASSQVWWKCQQGHEWKAKISHRTRGTKCPTCAKSPEPGRDLATCFPEIAKQWHPTKNSTLTPKDVSMGSAKSVWWVCEQGHEWNARIKSRTRGHGCPVCTNRTIRVGVNDFATKYPNLIKEWHPTKNKQLTPDMVGSGSSRKVWWRCEFGHEWEAEIKGRVRGNGCPGCGHQTSFNEQAFFYYIQQMQPDALNRVKIDGKEVDVFIPSLKIAFEYDGWWHDDSRVAVDIQKAKHMTQKGLRFIRVREPSCAVLPEKIGECFILPSTKRHDIENAILWALQHVQQLHPPLHIPDVDLRRDELTIASRITTQKQEHSLAYLRPEISQEWDWEKNAPLTPEMVTPCHPHKVFWKCVHGHSYSASPKYRTQSNKGCPYCCNSRVLIGFNDLATTHPDLLNAWCFERNTVLPTEITVDSGYEVAWICPNGHIHRKPVLKYIENADCARCANIHKQSRACMAQYEDGTVVQYTSTRAAAKATGHSNTAIRNYCNQKYSAPNNEQWSWVT